MKQKHTPVDWSLPLYTKGGLKARLVRDRGLTRGRPMLVELESEHLQVYGFRRIQQWYCRSGRLWRKYPYEHDLTNQPPATKET